MSESLRQQIFSSNEAPNEIETQEITSIIAHSLGQIKACISIPGDEIPTPYFRWTLEAVRQYNKHLRVMAIIRTVPNEILIQIFNHLFSDDDPFINPAPITHVCRHWRTVAQPLLPSSGVFVTPRGTVNSSGRSKEVLQDFNAFLGTMLSSPNSHFSVVISDPLSRNDLKNPLVDAIFSESSRMYSLEMTLESSIFIQLAERLVNQLNTLRVLKLTISGNPSKYGGYLYLFESAKGLRHLELNSSIKLLIKFPVSQLVSYKEHSIADINAGHMLKYGPRLRKLEHVVRTPRNNPYSIEQWTEHDARPVTSLDIRTYNVEDNYSRSVDSEWSVDNDKIIDSENHLLLPDTCLYNLREIRIRDPDRNPIPSIMRIIRNSDDGAAVNLTKIAFCGLRPRPGQLYEILSLTPNLTDLECYDLCQLDAILLSGVNTPTNTPVPNLQSLVVHEAQTPSDINDLIAKRLTSKHPVCRKLTTARILYKNPLDTVDKARDVRVVDFPFLPLERGVSRMTVITEALERKMRKKSGWKLNQSILRRILPSSGQDDQRGILEVLTDLEAIEVINPYIVKLSYIHSLHAFYLQRFGAVHDPSDAPLLNRVRTLLDNWIAAFQLQQVLPSDDHPSPGTPKWLMIDQHCIAFDTQFSHNFAATYGVAWVCEVDNPVTEYDVLYGRYRPTTHEEVFWVHKECS